MNGCQGQARGCQFTSVWPRVHPLKAKCWDPGLARPTRLAFFAMDSEASGSNGVGIATLPEDTLYEIFRIIADTDNPVKGPLYLSHCSKSWRLLALSIPALWAVIQVGSPKPEYLERLVVWLERSRVNLLDINVSQRRTVDDAKFSEYLDSSLNILKPHTHRWRTVTVKGAGFPELIRTCKTVLATTTALPELKDLLLGYTTVGAPCTQFTNGISEAPQLPKLTTLVVPSYHVDTRHIPLWQENPLFGLGLKKLVLHSAMSKGAKLGVTDCLGLLQHFVLLEELIIQDFITHSPLEPDDDQWYNPVIVPDQMVVAQNLRIARFGPNNLTNLRNAFLALIVHIEAPKLVEFHQQVLPLRFLPALVAIAEFPFPSLGSLMLVGGSGVSVRLDDVMDMTMQFLSRVPELRFLEFQNTTFRCSQPTSIEDLQCTVRTIVSAVCPKLEDLVLHMCSWGLK